MRWDLDHKKDGIGARFVATAILTLVQDVYAPSSTHGQKH